MRFLVMGDTHGENNRIKALLEQYAGQVQAVFHVGDHDYDLLQFKDTTKLPLLAVAGNCDDTNLSSRERLLTFGERRVYITHGNAFQLYLNTNRLVNRAHEKGASVCFFGHTHESAIFTVKGIFFMNPGSLANPRDGKRPSYGLLDIDDKTGNTNGEIIFL
jgi:hypothetical protein